MTLKTTRSAATLEIIVPCFNEEAALPNTAIQINAKLEHLIKEQKITSDSAVVYVDDGSGDETWCVIESLCEKYSNTKGIKLSRNRGHQNALFAGLISSNAEITISIDADLQDDLNAIDEMLNAYAKGAEIVYGVRVDRGSDTLFKRVSAMLFYKTMKLFGVETVYNHADFRLMSRKALDALGSFREVNLYLRGIVPLVGFSHATVEYTRTPRLKGESKYPMRKMIGLAVNGITSFSVVPLNFIFYLSLVVILLVLGLAVWALWEALVVRATVPGWASTVLAILFIGGVQIFCLGIVGTYLGKIYAEAKARPRYIIEKTVTPDSYRSS